MEAGDQLRLDEVRLVVAASPPHKRVEHDPGAAVRVELARLAAAQDPGLDVSTVELERPGPSFTVDTLRALHDQHPADQFTFIVGGDMAHSLLSWKQPEAVLELARFGVAEREEIRRRDVCDVLSGLEGVPERLDFFDMPRLDVSSSLVRRRVAAGRPIRHLVPAGVAERIAALDLYRAGAPAWA
jgi:nicotinate-nucleotide adenylyltransferase